MHSRQSTMFKPIIVFAIWSAFVAIAYGQGFSEVAPSKSSDSSSGSTTAVSTTDSKNGNNSILNGHLLVRLLDFLQGGPLGLIFRPLAIVLRPIFTTVDRITLPLFSIARFGLAPLNWLLTAVLIPIRGVAGLNGSVASLAKGLLSRVGSLPSNFLSIVTGLLSHVLSAVSDHTGSEPRNKRAIMDSLTGMAWNALSLPFRHVFDMFGPFLSIIRFIFNIVTWPLYHYYSSMTGSHHSTELALSADMSSIRNMVPSFLLNLTDYPQEAIVQLLMNAWGTVKTYALPALDRFFVWASSSTAVPMEIQALLNSMHAGYSMLHMLGIV